MNRVFSLKRMACILTAAVLLLSVSCAAGEYVYVDYDAEPVRAENAEAFNGVWQARYYARGGVTVTFESLLEEEVRHEHPGYTDEEVAAKVAEKNHYAVEIKDGIILNYMGESEPEVYEAVFGDGKLVVYGKSEIPITVEILSDGNLRVDNGNFSAVYEKEPGEEFLFRGKIRWGMTQAEVTALEGEGSSGQLSEDYRGISYPGMPVSRYTGELTYLFAADRLVLATYTLVKSDQEAGMFDYVREALDAVYGGEAEAARDELYRILEKVRPGEVLKDFMNMPLVKWVTAGDTRVLLAEDDFTVYIVYVSPDFMNTPAAEPVDTTGL